MKIAEAMLELNRTREYIEYLKKRMLLGFKIKTVDQELGDKFIKDTFQHLDICYKRHDQLKAQVIKSLTRSKIDRETTLIDAFVNLESLKEKRDVFDKSMENFVEVGDTERIRKNMETFQSILKLISKIEKSILEKISSLEAVK